jgi:hypothetical protein
MIIIIIIVVVEPLSLTLYNLLDGIKSMENFFLLLFHQLFNIQVLLGSNLGLDIGYLD